MAQLLTATNPPGNRRIAILTYHAVFPSYEELRRCPPAEAWYALTVPQFEAQMQHLSEEGFATPTLTEFLEGKAAQESVVLTFDDGHETHFRVVFPILQKFGFRAQFFVTVSSIGLPGFMNWTHLETLSNAGMPVESHGLHHHAMTKLSDGQLYSELRSSKDQLEARLGRPVRYFAIPGGFTSRRVYRQALAAGYLAICNSEPGLAVDSEILSRIVIAHATSQRSFERLVRRDFLALAQMRVQRDIGKAGKAMMGIRAYEALKRSVSVLRDRSDAVAVRDSQCQ